jgi:deoxyribodipyrimidine photo-lyase
MIHEQRVHLRNRESQKDRRYVLHWMQASQRARYNHALEYAIEKANELHKPLLVLFGITENFPNANLRHYLFMLEGLSETKAELAHRGIQLVIVRQSPEKAAVEFAQDACLVVVDGGYLRIQRQWREYAAQNIDCPLIEVESDVIVPVEEASGKDEYSAGTLRPRITSKFTTYLVPLKKRRLKIDSLGFNFNDFVIDDVTAASNRLNIDKSVKPSPIFHGGTAEAKKHLQIFIAKKLERYDTDSNNPGIDSLSNMSPYLHFGQISPLQIALEAAKQSGPGPDSFLEELIVRRELSINFVYYNRRYDSYECLPPWAKRTLAFHAKDKRPQVYSLEEFETAKTHDQYWNAAQMEMVITGKMHGYMRMYWGKKIIEWSKTPQSAYTTMLYLNDKYELDGRDPNGFANVAWCFGLHDRAWGERKIFGKTRYMNAAGLERKFDVDAYIEKIKQFQQKAIVRSDHK